MPQLRVHVTPELARALEAYMRRKGIRRKSDAVRQALKEAMTGITSGTTDYDYRTWLGMGLTLPLARKPRFRNQKDLWR